MYGLEINWQKTVAMSIKSSVEIKAPSGQPIRTVDQAVFRGGLLNTTTSAKPEVTKRLGEARSGFKALQQCWDMLVSVAKGRSKSITIASRLSCCTTWSPCGCCGQTYGAWMLSISNYYGRYTESHPHMFSSASVLQTSGQSSLSRHLAIRQGKL